MYTLLYTGYGSVHPVIHWVWERYTLVYTPGYGRRGTPPGYTPPYVHPGYTSIPPSTVVHYMLPLAAVRCQLTMPWAQKEGIPWVRTSQYPKVYNPVTVGVPVCAESFRSPREKDRMIG